MIKVVRFYILNDDPNEIFWLKNRNKMFVYENEKVFFKSKHFGSIQETKVEYVLLDLNDKVTNSLYKLISEAIKDADTITDEPIVQKQNTIKEIETIIFSYIFKASYSENYSIFELVTNIFINCLMKHAFENGNKRFSLSFLILILKKFGYYFKWTKPKEYEKYENEIKKFVENMENNNLENERINVLNWIIKNSVVNYENYE